MNRRKFIKTGTLGVLLGANQAANSEEGTTYKHPTPGEIEGPFYPVIAQKDKDFDLTRIKGHESPAKGDHIFIRGSVFDTDGNPVEDAIVDLWQANTFGKYAHPHDPNPAPVDENFQGWAIVPSGKNGEFRFKTVLPGAYPASRGWVRPPHIHFKVSKRGYRELVTQMYFPGQSLNQLDRLLQRKSEAEQKLMIAKSDPDNTDTFIYQIVIEKI